MNVGSCTKVPRSVRLEHIRISQLEHCTTWKAMQNIIITAALYTILLPRSAWAGFLDHRREIPSQSTILRPKHGCMFGGSSGSARKDPWVRKGLSKR